MRLFLFAKEILMHSLCRGGRITILSTTQEVVEVPDELAAQCWGREMLEHANVDATGLASFLEKIAARQGREEAAISQALGFLASHPPTQERVDTLTQIADPNAAKTPVLPQWQWESLKNICSDTVEVNA